MNIAIVLSGGTGTRLGASLPKQYIKVNGKMLVTYSLDTLANHSLVDEIVVVAGEEWHSAILEEVQKLGACGKKIKTFAKPGTTRQCSIYNGLEIVDKYWEGKVANVLIHDAARPNITAEMISECFMALEHHEGVMPVLPMKDTIYISRDKSTISELLDRDTLFAGQAPEAFCFKKYLEANKRLLPERISLINGASEPAVLAGMDVVMIDGDEYNYKITTHMDLERFRDSLLNDG